MCLFILLLIIPLIPLFIILSDSGNSITESERQETPLLSSMDEYTINRKPYTTDDIWIVGSKMGDESDEEYKKRLVEAVEWMNEELESKKAAIRSSQEREKREKEESKQEAIQSIVPLFVDIEGFFLLFGLVRYFMVAKYPLDFVIDDEGIEFKEGWIRVPNKWKWYEISKIAYTISYRRHGARRRYATKSRQVHLWDRDDQLLETINLESL